MSDQKLTHKYCGIAAYFAFAEVDDVVPKSELVSIYVFDFQSYQNDWQSIYSYDNLDPHVSLFAPKSLGNRRQFIQQGFQYFWTNVSDIELHLEALEKIKGKNNLDVYHISIKEKYRVMNELEVMGITAYSLFGTLDSLCRHYKDSIFRLDKIGKGPFERMLETLQLENGGKSES